MLVEASQILITRKFHQPSLILGVHVGPPFVIDTGHVRLSLETNIAYHKILFLCPLYFMNEKNTILF